jgi:hypothetical protein
MSSRAAHVRRWTCVVIRGGSAPSIGSRRRSKSAQTSRLVHEQSVACQQPAAHLRAFDERVDLGEFLGGELAQRLERQRACVSAREQDAGLVEGEAGALAASRTSRRLMLSGP